jgi:8-oxo-dGTP pyrophosphatase MutT (NUDIX family)
MLENMTESITFEYLKNTEKAPNLGSRFGQDVEPSGMYIIKKTNDFIPSGWINGEVTINNPLIISVDENNLVKWKNELSNKYNLKGKKLTNKLISLGYDAIITKYSNGDTGEIILFNPEKQINNKNLNESTDNKFITVYHGTKPKFVSSIKQNGLVDKSGYNQGWYVVSTDFESALFHSHPDEDKGDTNVIEFKIPINNNDKWLGYPYLWKGEKMNDNSTWFALMQKLPSEFITKIHTVDYDTFIKQKNSGFSNINENNMLLTEKLTNVDSDVDLLYDKYFKTDIDELNRTGIITKEMFETNVIGDDTNILNSEDSIKANETNRCELIINYRLGNAYRPSTKTIFLSANRNAINYVLNDFNGDYKKALDSLKGSNQYDTFKMEFTEERIKGSIHHELAHWIDDTNNNQHINKRTQIATKLGTRDINNVPVNSTKMEIQGQIHNIKQVYNKYKENWNELSLKDLFNLTPTLNIVFNNLKDSFKKQWLKDLILRMNRENLLGDKMRINSYGLNENSETPSEYIERMERQTEDGKNYQIFVDRIIKELKNNGIENDYYSLSKSKTTFGQSWYIIFKNDLEIRISNHSVTSNNRILDNKYVAFINVHKEYSDDDIKNIINEYIRLKNIKYEIEYKRQSSFNKLKEIDDNIKNNSLEFIENLKNNKKAIFDSGKTFQSIDTIKEKHPDWENVLQLPYQNGFIYYYIKQNNGYGNYNINKEYYNFLVKNNIINKDMINENTLNESNMIINTLKPTILDYLGIEGKVTKKEVQDLEKEIESNYSETGVHKFGKENKDIKQNVFNYEEPLTQVNINGVNLIITQGLLRDDKMTYLLYADGKLIGEFNSVKDIKTLIKYIEERLVKNTLNEENSDLKGTILKIVSPNIQKHLNDLIKEYGDKAEIIKHIVSAIDDKPEYSLTYEYAKKIKNYFDNFKGNNTSEEYQLHGGIKLKNYINLILAMKRDSISTGKDVRKNMTILNNTHLKSHDKSTIGLTRNPMALKEHIELIENYTPTKKASCGVILNAEKKILLVKRGIDTKWFPGKWALVGGKVDGDEEFKDAFIREVKEETNLDLNFIKYCFNKHDGDCEVALFVAITKTPNDIKINKEHSEYKWCLVKDIKELDCVPHIYEDISECLKRLVDNKEDLLSEEYNHSEYLSWKRKNVTIRGVKEAGQENNAGAMLGRGLYTAFLSNKDLAKQYGTVKFVVNAIPKKPKVFNNLNEWEIWEYNTLINNYCKEHDLKVSKKSFYENTTIEDEMQKLGFDGIIIKGREMVNYKPENVLYFSNENQLINYYESTVKN